MSLIDEQVQEEMVQVTFETRIDVSDPTDDDLIAMGRFVQEVAAAQREREKGASE